MHKYLTEFLGTLLFVMTIGLVVTAANPMAPLVIGSALMVVVYMGGHISGAHYNPAVTLAVFLRGRMPAKDVAPYMVAQVLGATVGAYLSYMFLDRTFAPAPAATSTTMTTLLIEGFYTFLLALTVLNVAVSKATKGNSYYGLAIGFAIVIAVYAGGPISGGAFNPAVASGPTIVNALMGGGNYSHLWCYLVGPFAGGILASIVFRLQEAEG
jgi:aquaporin Z